MKALLEAKAVSPPAAAPAAAPKGPTKAQRERIRVGDRSLFEMQVDAPAMNLSSRFEKEEKISAVGPAGYTVQVEVVKGEPPPGMPKKGTVEMAFADMIDYGTWKVGETKEEADKTAKVRRTRLADEQVAFGDRMLDCLVVQSRVEATGGGITVTTKNWFAKSTEIPGLGFVKEETTQEMAAPQGKISITQSTRLLSVERGKP